MSGDLFPKCELTQFCSYVFIFSEFLRQIDLSDNQVLFKHGKANQILQVYEYKMHKFQLYSITTNYSIC